MIKSPTLLVTIHVVAWLLFFSLIVNFITASSETTSIAQLLLTPQFLFFAFAYIFLFYSNTYYLIPSLYFKKRYFLYSFIVFVLFAGVYFFKPFDRLFQLQNQHRDGLVPRGSPLPPRGRGPFLPRPNAHFSPPQPQSSGDGEPMTKPTPHADIISLILFIMMWLIGWALQIVRQWRRVEKRAARAEAGKTQAELSFLKAQINPHFLFNTLNNIYSLAVSKSENTADSIMKLSKIMRYVTDEVSRNFVALENEIEFIRDYIDLQRLRLTSKITLDFSVFGDAATRQIAPLILMPFIENIFKYGISNREKSEITIHLFIEEKKIRLFCRNKIFTSAKDERTGIGIENTRQRLEHLYPQQHSLKISTDNGLYTVDLSLKI